MSWPGIVMFSSIRQASGVVADMVVAVVIPVVVVVVIIFVDWAVI